MATSDLDIGFPTAPATDPASGELTPVWRRFMLCLWTRSGASTTPARGVSSGQLSAQLTTLLGLGSQAPVAVAAGASPYAYAAPSSGTLYVSGGGVVAMTIRRSGGVAYPVGQFYGGHRMSAADTLTVTYVAAPTMVFFPG